MKRIFILLISLTLNITLFSHPWKPGHYVIVDTDGGIDDMRAITMFLASPDVRVLAITVSPGILNTNAVYIKVRSLLNSFYHEGLPIGINRTCNFKSPDFPAALNTVWGNESGLDEKDAPDCMNLIREILSVEKTKVSFICLGGMSTASSAILELPVFRKQVKEIIWSGGGLNDTEGFNFKIDAQSVKKVLRENIPVSIIKDFGEDIFFDNDLLKEINLIKTPYAGKISGFFKSDEAKGHTYSFMGNDEMLPLFLHYPRLFKTDSSVINSESTPLEKQLLKESVIKILKGETVVRNQVIREMPSDSDFYSDDIKPSVTEIIEKYGKDEWTSGIIANELHRHLGVFAIIGVKMGIRAREYFNTGVDEFSAVSFAGSLPPLSCMNDGIQVSTGATPGHGLLTVKNVNPTIPSAEFTYMNRKIRLTLKPEIANMISSELREINFIYGLDSNIYWELVRKNSIKYWRDLDRHDIFTIEEIL